ncbi:MAG: glucodextranase DOMON-like domain-containing protein [Thermoanaerobaculia bacterium]
MTNSCPPRCRRALAFSVAVVALLAAVALPASAVEQKLFVLSDPEKDDHGDGHLTYPVRSQNDLVPGSLDILSFSAWNTPDGTWFETTFARAITKTERRPIDEGGTMLTDVAKLGFYTFNVDVYIDVDGKPGSGNTRMLPGRNVEIDPANGWEKAVCLTPLPQQAETLIRRAYAEVERREAREKETEDGRLTAEQKKEIKSEVNRQVAESVFFPTVVEIRGRVVRFFVPITFLGGPAKAEWGYVVGAPGADVSGQYDLVKLAGLKPNAPLEPLFIMRAAPGRTNRTFGGADDEDPAPPALIDIIVPPGGETQEKLLSNSNLKTHTLPKLPAVVPAKLAPPAAK